MADHFDADLDQLVPQRRQSPMRPAQRRCQAAALEDAPEASVRACRSGVSSALPCGGGPQAASWTDL